VKLCVTRGELPPIAKAAPQEKREIHYALGVRPGNGRGPEIFLVQRALDASLMPAMWELPEKAGLNGAGTPSITLRHSITVTDYTVQVWRISPQSGSAGRWIAAERLGRMALTGLARKILKASELLRPSNKLA
jgi:hypothetical protein